MTRSRSSPASMATRRSLRLGRSVAVSPRRAPKRSRPRETFVLLGGLPRTASVGETLLSGASDASAESSSSAMVLESSESSEGYLCRALMSLDVSPMMCDSIMVGKQAEEAVRSLARCLTSLIAAGYGLGPFCALMMQSPSCLRYARWTSRAFEDALSGAE